MKKFILYASGIFIMLFADCVNRNNSPKKISLNDSMAKKIQERPFSDSNYERRKKIADYYLNCADSLAKITKNTRAKLVLSFFRKHYFIADPDTDCLALLSEDSTKFLGVVTLLEKEICPNLCLFRDTKGMRAAFDPTTESVYVKEKDKLGVKPAGIIFLHELNHAYNYYVINKKNLARPKIVKADDELETYKFTKIMYHELAGENYDSLLEKRAKEIKETIMVKRQRFNLLENIGYYENQLCRMFGCSEKDDQGELRNEFLIQSYFTYIELRYEKSVWDRKKADFIIAAHTELGFHYK